MAVYSRREVSTRRVEYFLPNPTNWVEYDKALTGITQEFRQTGRALADDSITVTANDDEIVLSFEETHRDRT